MKGEKYVWMTLFMIFIVIGTIVGFFFLQDQEISALNANSPGNASQYSMFKYTILGAGIGLEILLVVRVVMTALSERPKTKRIKLKVSEPGKKKPERLKLKVAEPAKKEKKPERLKLKVAEPSKKEEKPKLKLRAAEPSPAEKERRIKGIIEGLWKKKGEASMDEIVSAAATQGIDKKDVEKFLKNEKKRGKLSMEA